MHTALIYFLVLTGVLTTLWGTVGWLSRGWFEKADWTFWWRILLALSCVTAVFGGLLLVLHDGI